jgi:hypothetical protein
MKKDCSLLSFLCVVCLSITAGTIFPTAVTAANPPAKHRHASPVSPVAAEAEATDADSSSYDDEESGSDEQSATSSESSADGQSAASDESQGTSLLGVVMGCGFGGMLIAGFLCFFAIAPVLIPALFWHGGNILRGGRKPEVG